MSATATSRPTFGKKPSAAEAAAREARERKADSGERRLGSPAMWAGAIAATAAIGFGGAYALSRAFPSQPYQQQYASKADCEADNPGQSCAQARTTGGGGSFVYIGPTYYSRFDPSPSERATGVGAPARGGAVDAPRVSERGGVGSTGRAFSSTADASAGG